MTRMEDMVRMHGEVCSKKTAAQILSVGVRTVFNMVTDGRLEESCGGTMVDVRSICRYIESGKSRCDRGW